MAETDASPRLEETDKSQTPFTSDSFDSVLKQLYGSAAERVETQQQGKDTANCLNESRFFSSDGIPVDDLDKAPAQRPVFLTFTDERGRQVWQAFSNPHHAREFFKGAQSDGTKDAPLATQEFSYKKNGSRTTETRISKSRSGETLSASDVSFDSTTHELTLTLASRGSTQTLSFDGNSGATKLQLTRGELEVNYVLSAGSVTDVEVKRNNRVVNLSEEDRQLYLAAARLTIQQVRDANGIPKPLESVDDLQTPPAQVVEHSAKEQTPHETARRKFLDRGASEQDRQSALRTLSTMSKSKDGQSDADLLKSIRTFEAIEKVDAILKAGSDPHKAAKALIELKVAARDSSVASNVISQIQRAHNRPIDQLIDDLSVSEREKKLSDGFVMVDTRSAHGTVRTVKNAEGRLSYALGFDNEDKLVSVRYGSEFWTRRSDGVFTLEGKSGTHQGDFTGWSVSQSGDLVCKDETDHTTRVTPSGWQTVCDPQGTEVASRRSPLLASAPSQRPMAETPLAHVKPVNLEQLQTQLRSISEQMTGAERLESMVVDVSSDMSAAQLIKLKAELNDELLRGNRRAARADAWVGVALQSHDSKTLPGKDPSVSFQNDTKGRIARIDTGGKSLYISYDGDSKQPCGFTMPSMLSEKPLSGPMFEHSGVCHINENTGEVTVIERAPDAGSLARTERSYSPDGHVRAVKFNESGLRTEETLTKMYQKSNGPELWPELKEYLVAKTEYQYFDRDGAQTSNIQDVAGVEAVQVDGSKRVTMSARYGSVVALESDKPSMKLKVQFVTNGDNEVEIRTLTDYSNPSEETAGVITKGRNTKTGEISINTSLVENSVKVSQSMSFKADGTPASYAREEGSNRYTFDFESDSPKVKGVKLNGKDVTDPAQLERLTEVARISMASANPEAGRSGALKLIEGKEPSRIRPTSEMSRVGDLQKETLTLKEGDRASGQIVRAIDHRTGERILIEESPSSKVKQTIKFDSNGTPVDFSRRVGSEELTFIMKNGKIAEVKRGTATLEPEESAELIEAGNAILASAQKNADVRTYRDDLNRVLLNRNASHDQREQALRDLQSLSDRSAGGDRETLQEAVKRYRAANLALDITDGIKERRASLVKESKTADGTEIIATKANGEPLYSVKLDQAGKLISYGEGVAHHEWRSESEGKVWTLHHGERKLESVFEGTISIDENNTLVKKDERGVVTLLSLDGSSVTQYPIDKAAGTETMEIRRPDGSVVTRVRSAQGQEVVAVDSKGKETYRLLLDAEGKPKYFREKTQFMDLRGNLDWLSNDGGKTWTPMLNGKPFTATAKTSVSDFRPDRPLTPLEFVQFTSSQCDEPQFLSRTGKVSLNADLGLAVEWTDGDRSRFVLNTDGTKRHLTDTPVPIDPSPALAKQKVVVSLNALNELATREPPDSAARDVIDRLGGKHEVQRFLSQLTSVDPAVRDRAMQQLEGLVSPALTAQLDPDHSASRAGSDMKVDANGNQVTTTYNEQGLPTERTVMLRGSDVIESRTSFTYISKDSEDGGKEPASVVSEIKNAKGQITERLVFNDVESVGTNKPRLIEAIKYSDDLGVSTESHTYTDFSNPAAPKIRLESKRSEDKATGIVTVKSSQLDDGVQIVELATFSPSGQPLSLTREIGETRFEFKVVEGVVKDVVVTNPKSLGVDLSVPGVRESIIKKAEGVVGSMQVQHSIDTPANPESLKPTPPREGHTANGIIIVTPWDGQPFTYMVKEGEVRGSHGRVIAKFEDNGKVVFSDGRVLDVLKTEGATFHGLGSDGKRLDLVSEQQSRKLFGVITDVHGKQYKVMGSNIFDGPEFVGSIRDGIEDMKGRTHAHGIIAPDGNRGELVWGHHLLERFGNGKFEGVENGRIRVMQFASDAQDGRIFIPDAISGRMVEHQVRMGMVINRETGEQLGILRAPTMRVDRSLVGGAIILMNGQAVPLANFTNASFTFRSELYGGTDTLTMEGVALGPQEIMANGQAAPHEGGLLSVTQARQVLKLQDQIKEHDGWSPGRYFGARGRSDQEVGRASRWLGSSFTSGRTGYYENRKSSAPTVTPAMAMDAIGEGRHSVGMVNELNRRLAKTQQDLANESLIWKRQQLDRRSSFEMLPANTADINGTVKIPTFGANGQLQQTLVLKVEKGQLLSSEGQLFGRIENIIDEKTGQVRQQGLLRMCHPLLPEFNHMGEIEGAVWNLEIPAGSKTQKVTWISTGEGVVSLKDLKARANQEIEYAEAAYQMLGRSNKSARAYNETLDKRNSYVQLTEGIVNRGIRDRAELAKLTEGPSWVKARAYAGPTQNKDFDPPALTARDISNINGRLRIGTDIFDIKDGKLFRGGVEKAQLLPGYKVQYESGKVVDLNAEPHVLLQFKLDSATYNFVGIGVGGPTANFGYQSGGLVDIRMMKKEFEDAISAAEEQNADYIESRPWLLGSLVNRWADNPEGVMRQLRDTMRSDYRKYTRTIELYFGEDKGQDKRWGADYDPRVVPAGFNPQLIDRSFEVSGHRVSIASVQSLARRIQVSGGWLAQSSAAHGELVALTTQLQQQVANSAEIAVTTIATAGTGTVFSTLAKFDKISKGASVALQVAFGGFSGAGASVLTMSDASNGAAHVFAGGLQGVSMALPGAVGSLKKAPPPHSFAKFTATTLADSAFQTTTFEISHRLRSPHNESFDLGQWSVGVLTMFGTNMAGHGLGRAADKFGGTAKNPFTNRTLFDVRPGQPSLAASAIQGAASAFSYGAIAELPNAVSAEKQRVAKSLGFTDADLVSTSSKFFSWGNVAGSMKDAGAMAAAPIVLPGAISHEVGRRLEKRLAPHVTQDPVIKQLNQSLGHPKLIEALSPRLELMRVEHEINTKKLRGDSVGYELLERHKKLEGMAEKARAAVEKLPPELQILYGKAVEKGAAANSRAHANEVELIKVEKQLNKDPHNKELQKQKSEREAFRDLGADSMWKNATSSLTGTRELAIARQTAFEKSPVSSKSGDSKKDPAASPARMSGHLETGGDDLPPSLPPQLVPANDALIWEFMQGVGHPKLLDGMLPHLELLWAQHEIKMAEARGEVIPTDLIQKEELLRSQNVDAMSKVPEQQRKPYERLIEDTKKLNERELHNERELQRIEQQLRRDPSRPDLQQLKVEIEAFKTQGIKELQKDIVSRFNESPEIKLAKLLAFQESGYLAPGKHPYKLDNGHRFVLEVEGAAGVPQAVADRIMQQLQDSHQLTGHLPEKVVINAGFYAHGQYVTDGSHTIVLRGSDESARRLTYVHELGHLIDSTGIDRDPVAQRLWAESLSRREAKKTLAFLSGVSDRASVEGLVSDLIKQPHQIIKPEGSIDRAKYVTSRAEIFAEMYLVYHEGQRLAVETGRPVAFKDIVIHIGKSHPERAQRYQMLQHFEALYNHLAKEHFDPAAMQSYVNRLTGAPVPPDTVKAMNSALSRGDKTEFRNLFEKGQQLDAERASQMLADSIFARQHGIKERDINRSSKEYKQFIDATRGDDVRNPSEALKSSLQAYFSTLPRLLEQRSRVWNGQLAPALRQHEFAVSVYDSQTGARIPLAGEWRPVGRNEVGESNSNYNLLVSKEHVLMRQGTDGVLWIKCNDKNGVWVNGRELKQNREMPITTAATDIRLAGPQGIKLNLAFEHPQHGQYKLPPIHQPGEAPAVTLPTNRIHLERGGTAEPVSFEQTRRLPAGSLTFDVLLTGASPEASAYLKSLKVSQREKLTGDVAALRSASGIHEISEHFNGLHEHLQSNQFVRELLRQRLDAELARPRLGDMHFYSLAHLDPSRAADINSIPIADRAAIVRRIESLHESTDVNALVVGLNKLPDCVRENPLVQEMYRRRLKHLAEDPSMSFTFETLLNANSAHPSAFNSLPVSERAELLRAINEVRRAGSVDDFCLLAADLHTQHAHLLENPLMQALYGRCIRELVAGVRPGSHSEGLTNITRAIESLRDMQFTRREFHSHIQEGLARSLNAQPHGDGQTVIVLTELVERLGMLSQPPRIDDQRLRWAIQRHVANAIVDSGTSRPSRQTLESLGTRHELLDQVRPAASPLDIQTLLRANAFRYPEFGPRGRHAPATHVEVATSGDSPRSAFVYTDRFNNTNYLILGPESFVVPQKDLPYGDYRNGFRIVDFAGLEGFSTVERNRFLETIVGMEPRSAGRPRPDANFTYEENGAAYEFRGHSLRQGVTGPGAPPLDRLRTIYSLSQNSTDRPVLVVHERYRSHVSGTDDDGPHYANAKRVINSLSLPVGQAGRRQFSINLNTK